MTDDLTPMQRRVLDTFERLTIERNGQPPPMREVGAAVGLRSSSTVQLHLRTLVRKGYLVASERTRQGLRLARHIDGRCPMCGSVTA